MAGVTISSSGGVSVQRSLLSITADTNNANPGQFSAVLIIGTAFYNVTGFSGGEANRLLIIVGGSSGATIDHQSASSTAANRMMLNGASLQSLSPWHVAIGIYQNTDQRWIQCGQTTVLV